LFLPSIWKGKPKEATAAVLRVQNPSLFARLRVESENEKREKTEQTSSSSSWEAETVETWDWNTNQWVKEKIQKEEKETRKEEAKSSTHSSAENQKELEKESENEFLMPTTLWEKLLAQTAYLGARDEVQAGAAIHTCTSSTYRDTHIRALQQVKIVGGEFESNSDTENSSSSSSDSNLSLLMNDMGLKFIFG
jgi:hypothetical protein